MKKLQIALDFTNEADALNVLRETAGYIDIVECGTPLMVACGSDIVKKIKDLYPDKEVFADIKVVDGGAHVPESVLKAGADIVSVLGAAEYNTIKAANDLIHEFGAKTMIDLILVGDLWKRVQELNELKPDIWSVHVAYDVQGEGVSVLEEYAQIENAPGLKAIAGGIKLETFEEACKTSADILIVGGGLCQVEKPGETARKMYEIIERYR